MLLSIAILLCTTVDNWPIPCSVKAKGKVGRNFKVWRWSQFATTSLDFFNSILLLSLFHTIIFD